jgi:hypothetical protein
MNIYETNEVDADIIFSNYGAVVFGGFENFVNQTGWTYLYISTNSNFSDTVQVENSSSRNLLDVHCWVL